LRTSVD